MASTQLVVGVEYVGNETGLWCTDCNLSTGVCVWFTVTFAGVISLRSNLVCSECRRRNITAA